MSRISFVIPVHNEEANVPLVYDAIAQVMAGLDAYAWDLIFVDDGSKDRSLEEIEQLASKNLNVKYLELSRNFGKEIATTAGLHNAEGDAVIVMDADLQHPPQLVPIFLEHWKNGADMVIGVRNSNRGEGIVKKLGSRAFYFIMHFVSETEITPAETDFRLIDRRIILAFRKCTERNRMTRGLLNWLGFRRVHVPFDANARQNGDAAYSVAKLIKLAITSFTSHSLIPLKVAGYLGIAMVLISIPALIFMVLERFILNDPLDLRFSGPAILGVFNLFLIGTVLSCLGLIALYVANIHIEVVNRPMYIVRSKKV